MIEIYKLRIGQQLEHFLRLGEAIFKGRKGDKPMIT